MLKVMRLVPLFLLIFGSYVFNDSWLYTVSTYAVYGLGCVPECTSRRIGYCRCLLRFICPRIKVRFEAYYSCFEGIELMSPDSV